MDHPFSTYRNCVLEFLIEKSKAILNKKLKMGPLFMDLPKAFDTLDHSLLLAKTSAYSFDNTVEPL